MTMLPASKYLTDKSLAASFVGTPVNCALLNRVTFTGEWTAVASSDGDWYLETSDDPRVEADILRGSTTAKWNARTIPTASFDGTNATLSGKLITITASAGSMVLNVDKALLGQWVRLGFTRRAAGPVAQVYVSGHGE